jgi:hypothetical protein
LDAWPDDIARPVGSRIAPAFPPPGRGHMKIQVLHKSEHYVMIAAPLRDDGLAPTRASFLPMIEALRGIGLRFIDLALTPSNEGPALICEYEGDFSDKAQLLGWEVQNG